MALFYEDVLTALNEAGVRFIIVGGTAVILHGVPRTTADLNLVIDLDEANVLRLVEVATKLGFRPRAPVEPSQLADPEKRREWLEQKGMRAFTFQRPDRPLDVVDVLIDSPLSYQQLEANAESLHAEGLTLVIAGIDDLIEMKQAAGRAQDEADIDALRRLKAATR